MPVNNPLKMGELYLMTNPEDQEAVDELKQKVEIALSHLDTLIAALDERVTALEEA